MTDRGTNIILLNGHLKYKEHGFESTKEIKKWDHKWYLRTERAWGIQRESKLKELREFLIDKEVEWNKNDGKTLW